MNTYTFNHPSFGTIYVAKHNNTYYIIAHEDSVIDYDLLGEIFPSNLIKFKVKGTDKVLHGATIPAIIKATTDTELADWLRLYVLPTLNTPLNGDNPNIPDAYTGNQVKSNNANTHCNENARRIAEEETTHPFIEFLLIDFLPPAICCALIWFIGMFSLNYILDSKVRILGDGRGNFTIESTYHESDAIKNPIVLAEFKGTILDELEIERALTPITTYNKDLYHVYSFNTSRLDYYLKGKLTAGERLNLNTYYRKGNIEQHDKFINKTIENVVTSDLGMAILSLFIK